MSVPGYHFHAQAHRIQEQSLDSQVNTAALTDAMAHTFFWQYDGSVAEKCHLYANIVKASIAAAMVLVLEAAPALVEWVVGPAIAVEAEAATTVSEVAQAVSSILLVCASKLWNLTLYSGNRQRR